MTRLAVVIVALLAALVAPAASALAAHPTTERVAGDETPRGSATAHRLVTGLQGGSGSTIGPGGALYVTESAAGRITRVDPRTGATTTYASGLPRSIIGIGGPIDVAFLGRTA